MRKIVGKNIFGMAVMAAVFTMSPMMISGCTSQSAQPVTTQETSTHTSGVQSAKSFKPIPMAKLVTGNYTDDTDARMKATVECQHKNLHSMVGMTFMAYPSTETYQPFKTESGTNFSVRAPEKFTIESVQDIDAAGRPYSRPTLEETRAYEAEFQEGGKYSGETDESKIPLAYRGVPLHYRSEVAHSTPSGCRMNIKFESGKTAFIQVNNSSQVGKFGFLLMGSCDNTIPEFMECLYKIRDASGVDL